MGREYEYYRLIPSRTKKELNDWFNKNLKDGRKKESLLFELCQEYDLYFDYSLASNSDSLGKYIKNISILSQYKDKKFKDSVMNIENEETYEVPKHYHNFVLNNGLDICGYELDKKNLNSTAELKLDLLSALKNEQQLLLGKMKKAMDEDNIGTYKNLVQALREITYLVQKEEDKIENEKMYIDFGRDYTIIYFKEQVTKIKSPKVKTIVEEISKLSNSNKAIRICGDFRMATSLIDEIRSEGFNNIADTELSIVDKNSGTNYFINEKN